LALYRYANVAENKRVVGWQTLDGYENVAARKLGM
jgi:hypothetical protein